MTSMASVSRLGNVRTSVPWHRLSEAEAIGERVGGRAREVISDLVEHAADLEQALTDPEELEKLAAPIVEELKETQEALKETQEAAKEHEKRADEAEEKLEKLQERITELEEPIEALDDDVRREAIRRLAAQTVAAFIRSEGRCPWCERSSTCSPTCGARIFIDVACTGRVEEAHGPTFPGFCTSPFCIELVADCGKMCRHGQIIPAPVPPPAPAAPPSVASEVAAAEPELWVMARKDPRDGRFAFRGLGRFWVGAGVVRGAPKDALAVALAELTQKAQAGVRLVTLVEARAMAERGDAAA